MPRRIGELACSKHHADRIDEVETEKNKLVNRLSKR